MLRIRTNLLHTMLYELRILGNPPARFATEHEAIEAAAHAIHTSRTVEIELLDLATGKRATLRDRRHWPLEFKEFRRF